MKQLLKLCVLLGLLTTTVFAASHGAHVNRAHNDLANRAPSTVQLYRRVQAEFSWYKPAESGNEWVAFRSVCVFFLTLAFCRVLCGGHYGNYADVSEKPRVLFLSCPDKSSKDCGPQHGGKLNSTTL